MFCTYRSVCTASCLPLHSHKLKLWPQGEKCAYGVNFLLGLMIFLMPAGYTLHTSE